MARIEIVNPGNGTHDGAPEIMVDGVRVPGVVSWSMDGGGPIVEVRLECQVVPTQQRIENGTVKYKLAPMPIEMKRQLYAALIQELEN